jgi:predicted signal transduction protein with EAL and GGDEF domain
VASADTALVRAIVDLGRDLWLPVVAEGVETAAQRQALLSFGCPQAQGVLFAPPVPAEVVGAVLGARRLEPRAQPSWDLDLAGAGAAAGAGAVAASAPRTHA